MNEVSINNDTNFPLDTPTTTNMIDQNKGSVQHVPLKTEGITTTVIVKEKIEDYSMDDLGKIKYAQKHREANRPLHQIGTFTEDIDFCRCCDLPMEKKGIYEPFHVCDDIEEFSECGIGITLYFYFFKFITFISFVGICILSICLIIANLFYTRELKDVCKPYAMDKDENHMGYCNGFATSQGKTNLYRRFNNWFIRLSSDNIYAYRNFHEQQNRVEFVEDVLINYSILNFLFLLSVFILHILFFIQIKFYIGREGSKKLTIRDYSVLISNAKPILFYYNEHYRELTMKNRSQIEVENGRQFKDFVTNYIKNDKDLVDISINQINMCYDLGNYCTLRDDLEKCKRKIFQIEHNKHTIELNNRNKYYDDERYSYNYLLNFIGIYCCCRKKDKQYITLKKQKSDFERDLEQESRNVTEFVTEKNFTGYMLVSFNKIEDKKKFLEHYPHNFITKAIFGCKNCKNYFCCCCLSEGERIQFDKATGIDAYDPPEPDDIYWENFQYTSTQRRLRTFLVFLISILIMAISFACVLGLAILQDSLYDSDKNTEDSNTVLKYLVSLAITIVISIINTVIEYILGKATYYEKQISKSNYILSLSIKIAIATFLNSAIVPLISKHIVISYKYDDDKIKGYKIFRERDNLLVDDMLIYFIVNAIISPLLWIFRITYYIRRIRICCLERGNNPNQDHYMTQRELNKFYEYPDMDLAYKYAYLVKTLAMCMFYMPIFPMGFIISFVGFVFGYFLELLNFTQYCRRPEMFDSTITTVYTEFFTVLLFVGGLGDMIFLYDDIFSDTTNKWALANMLVYLILIFLPYTKLFMCSCFEKNTSVKSNSYLSDVYLTFNNDYQRQNPLTNKMGIMKYLAELKNHEYLSPNAYAIAEKNIDNLNLMEVYYGTTRGHIPIGQQSLINSVKGSTIPINQDIGKSIMGRTVIKPNLDDDDITKKKKKEFYDSRVYNLFGRGMVNLGMKGLPEVIEDTNEGEIKDNIEFLGTLPLSTSVVKGNIFSAENQIIKN